MAAAASSASIDRFCDNRLFEGIQRDLLHKIAPKLQVQRFAAGDIVFHEGDAGDSLYLVGEGSVRISKSGRGGKQETLGFIGAGNFFGEMALLDGQPRSAMATAAEPSLVGAVDEKTFQHILELAPSRLHLNFLRSVSERLRSVNSHFINEVMRSERLSLVGSMASTIIHDLKNPICIMRCCADLIEAEYTDQRLHELSAMINTAVDGMLAMTQELLDYARGSIKLDRKPVTIWRLLDDLHQQSLRLLPGKNIQFAKRISYDGVIEIDLARFTRVLANLIKNAREAMPNGGILTITSDLVRDEVVFRVSDTGCGIPAEVLPRIFEPFVTHGKKHGTGLGMAIAKSVVEAHQGRISVASVQGRGTTVDIRLPAAIAHPSRNGAG